MKPSPIASLPFVTSSNPPAKKNDDNEEIRPLVYIEGVKSKVECANRGKEKGT